MTEVITFPDAELLVCEWLTAALAGHGRPVPAVTRVPKPRPSEFVRVLRTGGPQLNLVQDNPTLVIEGWANLESRASSLLELARGLVKSMARSADAASVYRVTELGGPTNFPDPVSAQPRYICVVSMLLRGHAL